MAQPTPIPVPLEQTRQQVILQLCEHYAVDNLDDRALEERLDRANAAASLDELRGLVSDLPALRPGAPVRAPGTQPAPAPARGTFNPDRGVIVGIMGGAERRGIWTPARETSVIALMGGVELDMRQAQFAPGVTEMNIFAVMGGAEIIVPPGVHVDLNGVALMGGYAHHGDTEPITDPDAPVLRIGGFCLMGGVEVRTRYPGETGRDAKKRERLSREMMRLGAGRRDPAPRSR